MNLSSLLLLLLISLNMMNEESKTKVIAHRGAWKNTNVPENSIAALQHAIALKCYVASLMYT